MTIQDFRRRTWKRSVALAFTAVATASVAVVGLVVWSAATTRAEGSGTAAAAGESATAPGEGERAAEREPAAEGVVQLTDAQFQAVGVEVAEAATRAMTELRTVPGRIRYDDNRHVAVRVPTAGILQEILVKPGDTVESGQVLAIVSSPAVGTARADLLKRQSDVELAMEEEAWRQKTCRGLEALVAAIGGQRSMGSITDLVRAESLGSYREKVLEAYARLQLAESLLSNAQEASRQGALAGRTLQERASERDAAEAALTGNVEQLLFESKQACRAAEAASRDAHRRLQISQQQLETLLGYREEMSPSESGKPITQIELRAPFSGSIEARNYSRFERVHEGDTLLILADTSELWVEANVRESSWLALQLPAGTPLTVTLPTAPHQQLTAKLYYTGREVSSQTNAVELVASLKNPEGTLRPGQYARIALPQGPPRDCLAVPDTAVVEHEGHKFVFVPMGERSFRRQDVETGLEEGEWMEIRGGLEAGTTVVTAGAFALKSALLLEGEAE